MATPKLVIILGETASGKTALGIELAGMFGGEIIAADSRTVYRGLDIGTAKPTATELAAARHHLIDVAEPDQTFNAADFKRLANQAVIDIASHGKLPILVGGTGLYIDSLLYDYQFRPPADPAERARLQQLTIEQLQAEIIKRGLKMPDNPKNPRHLTRTLESGQAEATRADPRPNTLIIGLETDRTMLEQRIAERVEVMFQAGLVEEARQLFARYGYQIPALETPGYTALRRYLEGSISLAEAKAMFIHNDLLLAKRQRTWFRRNKSIHWLPQQGRLDKAAALITTFLNTQAD